MGNNNPKLLRNSVQSIDDQTNKQQHNNSQNNKDNISIGNSSIGLSFKSCQSQLSASSSTTSKSSSNSFITWAKLSKKRRSRQPISTNSSPLSYELSKTSWPLTQLELIFLPEFPLKNYEKQFEIVEDINQGSFGKVYKALDTTTQEAVALKVLLKFKIVKENCVRQVKEEVIIQKAVGHHPFIVNCRLHWQNKRNLFIVSDLLEGGELYNLLKRYSILPIALVQIYVAQIASTLDFLHNAGIIYRDLKPENLLLDKKGNINLIDFGLSKWLSYGNRTSTICGTLHYMAPEILHFQPYGHAVDWWSLGVIACLMLTGRYPDVNDDEKVVLPDNVVLEVPSKDLLLRLLEMEPTKRLRSFRTLKNIAFYKNFDLDKVLNMEVVPNELLPKNEFSQQPKHSVEPQLSLPASDEVIKME